MIDHEDIEPGYYWARYRCEYYVYGIKQPRISEWDEPQIIEVRRTNKDKRKWHVGTIDCDDGNYAKNFIFIKRINTDGWENE